MADPHSTKEPNPLFRRRTPEAAACQMAIVLVNLMECQLATLEGMPKRTSQHERKRQQDINDRYIAQLADLDIPANLPGLRGYPCPRVQDAINSLRAAQAVVAIGRNEHTATGAGKESR